MEANQVEQLIALYGAKLPIISINVVRRKLVSMDYVTASMYLAQMKDPTITIILSIFLGGYGIDRIYIGEYSAPQTVYENNIDYIINGQLITWINNRPSPGSTYYISVS